MSKKKSIVSHAIIFTVLMLALMCFVYNFNVPNPNMILIAALVLSTSIGGIIPGAICAFLMLLYSLFFFSTDHSFIHFTEVNIQKIVVITLGIIINYVSVALLKASRDRANREIKIANEELTRTNGHLEQTNNELKQVNELLKSMAQKDALTGLRNRYSLRQDFEMYVGIPLYALFLDLDNFKALNDTKGHAFGDKVLASVGKALTESFPTSNCYRYGGDEFLVIMENKQETRFLQDCDKAKGMLEASDISFSGGYVWGVPDSLAELRSMIIQSDEMLYHAKNEGKNCFKGVPFDHNYKPDQEMIAHHKSHIQNNHTYNR